jgi:hypothetical protein
MTDDIDRPLEEQFLDEMVEGHLDGFKADNPEPLANRSASYRHGFANGRGDMARSPRLPAHALRLLADQAVREDVARVTSPANRRRLSDPLYSPDSCCWVGTPPSVLAR